MESIAYPEAYINSTSDICISDSFNAILSSEILEKYQKEILENSNGCLFKLTYNNKIDNYITSVYVSCLEFSAPKGICYLSNKVFDRLLISLNNPCSINIELFNPPQATFIKFQIIDNLLNQLDDIKSTLETLFEKKYKFLYF